MAASSAVFFVYITAKNAAQARSIGAALVRERLVACVNIVGRIQSIYWWDGAIQNDHEALLIAKTRKSLFPRLVKRVKKLHSYEVPCIVALPITAGNPEYLKWIRKETARP